MLRDFTTDVTGWIFLAGALMLWGGWVLLPRRVGMFFQSDDFPAIGTRLQLWLRALGIDVCFTRKRGPTDHAKIERTYQPMTLQALLGQRWPDQTALWAGRTPCHAQSAYS